MRYIVAVFVLFCSLFSAELERTIKTKNNVLNAILKKDIMYISTDGGEVLFYDLKEDKFLKTLKLPNVKTYFDTQKAKIFNVDEVDGRILFLSSGDYSLKVLHIYENNTTLDIPLKNEGVKKALFIDKDNIALATLSSEIYIYNLKKKEIIDSYKISTSSLSDMEILKDDRLIYIGCESGKIHIFSIDKKKILATIDMHKDNIYDIEVSKNKTIVSGSADKFAGIFINNKKEHIKSNFLVYAVGVKKDGKKAAFMSDIDSQITIFDTKTLEIIDYIDTKQSTISGIVFYEDDKIISFAYEKDIKIWRY